MKDSPIQFCVYPQPGKSLRQELPLQELRNLFQVAAFWAQNRTIDDLEIALAHSKPIGLVRDGDRLIGFARATSDGVYRATIWDVVVHPDYQGKGIGRKLLDTLLSHPHLSRVERIYLMTTYQEKFYERAGFERNHSTTMVLNNRPVELLSVTDASNHQPQASNIQASF